MKKSKSLFVIAAIIFLVIIVGFFVLHLQEGTLTDEQKVRKIAAAYIEENYGTDYIVNGEVRNISVTEGDNISNYPTASFRIPADYYESGQLVDVMVDPDSEEIIKVTPSPSKAFPPFMIDLSDWETQVSQGESTSTNITLCLIYSEEEKTVPFSLELGAYENMPVDPNYPFPFEAIFEPEQLVLKHQEPKHTFLTLTPDIDAPLGVYTVTVTANDGNKGIGATIMITVVE